MSTGSEPIGSTPIGSLGEDAEALTVSLRGTGLISPAASLLAGATVALSGTGTLLVTNDLQLAEVSLLGSATMQVIPDFILYVSTREFISEPGGVVANVPFHGTLQRALRFNRSILGDRMGQVTLGWGEMEVINSEGDYDEFIEHYAIDGRRVVVRVGAAGPPWNYDDFMVVLDCTAADWHIEEDVLRVELRDNTYKLEVPAQPNIYAGTGGMEGGDDLKSKRIPRAFGDLDNITPASLIPAELVYQLNDGRIDAVTAVYDNGIALAAASPTADYASSTLLRAATQGAGQAIDLGEYATCLAEGLIRLGGSPVGRVTASLRGAKANVFTAPEDLSNSAWTKSAATVTANATTAPNGTATADKLVESATNANHHVRQGLTGGDPTQIWTVSFYAKSAEYSNVRVQLDAGSGAGAAASFDVDDVAIIGAVTGSGASASIEAVRSGWCRCVLTGIPAAGGGSQVRAVIYLNEGGTYTGDGTSGTYFWGLQLELGSEATFYPLDGGYYKTHADVIRRIIGTSSDVIDPTHLDTPSFERVNVEQPAVIAYYLDEQDESSAADVIANLANSMGGWAGFRRLGVFEVGIFNAPEDEDVPTACYVRTDLLEIKREKLPSGLTPPPFRFRVAWGRNWTVQADLAASVTAVRAAYLKEGFRLASSSSVDQQTILTDHPLAQDPAPIEAYYRDEADAQIEADRLLDLYGTTVRSLYRIRLKSHVFVHDVGEVIHLVYPRWDLAAGRRLAVVSLDEDTDENTSEIMGFG